ncbi:MAG: OsmC family protein [Candidatus Carbobacillus altaicus]|nr:OsmC family protein [Candidatus Carbobacillus altaicus]
MRTHLEWKGQMAFEAVGESGHVVRIDAAESVGGTNSGPRPMELVLHGLGGCTSIDIVSILNKMREPMETLHVDIEAERAEDHPKRFTKIHLHYRLTGDGLDEKKVHRAIELSMHKYCSASASLNAELTYSFEINGEKILNQNA